MMISQALAPVVEPWIIPSACKPGGIGEAGVSLLAPAVGKALFALTEKRFKDLPLAGKWLKLTSGVKKVGDVEINRAIVEGFANETQINSYQTRQWRLCSVESLF